MSTHHDSPLRSRRLWAMAMCAWLMLVVQSVVAMPMHSGVTHAVQAEASSTHAMPDGMMQGDHHAADEAAPCCVGGGGMPAPHPCHCASMCASALLVLPSASVSARVFADRFALRGAARAPARATLPPLRPPSV